MPQADKSIIRSAVEFWEKLYDVKDATVKFVKKDGTRSWFPGKLPDRLGSFMCMILKRKIGDRCHSKWLIG